MDYDKELQAIDRVIANLKHLRSELAKTQKMSKKCFEMSNATVRQCQRANTNLNWQCMYLDKYRKKAWKSILESEDVLKVSIEETEYHPSGFHSYKG